MTKKEKLEAIPALIKRIPSSHGNINTVIFSMSDVKKTENLFRLNNDVLNLFTSLVERSKKLLGEKSPSKVKRSDLWTIGNLFKRMQKRFVSEFRVDVTNLTLALANELNISGSSMGYIILFRKRLLKRDVNEQISWGKYLEALNLKTKENFLHCVSLIENGNLKTTSEIRNYVKQRNKN